jgi:hypothetical protein
MAGHPLVQPALLGRRQPPKPDVLPLEGDQAEERHLADSADQAGDPQVEPFEGPVVLEEAIEAPHVDAQTLLFEPPTQLRQAHAALVEDSLEL